MSTPARSSDATETRLPGNLQANRRLSQWLRITPEGVVSLSPGKVELGQGIITALGQIAAEELDVDFARIRVIPVNTGTSPNEGVTSGSLSIQDSGTAVRHACAEARAIYLAEAAAELGVPVETLRVDDGRITAPNGRHTSYWALAEDALLDREATGSVAPKRPADYKIVGRPVPRLDLPDKILGRPRFIHDLVLPHMLHGRVVRPASRGARLVALDDAIVRAMPGVVAVVRDGSFLGVLAEREEVAVKAAQALAQRATWDERDTLPAGDALAQWLRSAPRETNVVEEHAFDVRPACTYSATYSRPFTAHAAIGLSCALAQWRGTESVAIWTHSQGVYNLRTDLAKVLGLAADGVAVTHVEGAGCYGHNPADDAALDAALLARAALGRPVRLQWTREDELAWAPYGPAMIVDLSAGLDASGNIVRWTLENYSNGHTLRPGRGSTPALLAAWHLERPFEPPVAMNPPLPGGGTERNAVPLYDFPRRIVCHRVTDMPLRTSALRALGAFANVFAIESFMDELALAAGVDPVEYRLRHLKDERGRAVIEAAARRMGWSARQKAEGRGFGIAFAKYKNLGAYCAVVAEVEAEREIRVRRLTIAADVGLAVNPDGVANQMEGGAVQAASWTLKEAVKFDRRRVTSTSWEEYPILRFSEVPAVDVEILNRPEERAVGAGEAAQGPVAGAIANAVFDALGVRVRDLPITPERIVAAMG
ncbi:MAG: xanthine dehydrogenase family protein molybdopterin-binding subunit [Burkholderiales bacterium]|nr:xanthine dehydrogenase family protein molybdopterin-binding subunit [Burkholderiales bacterium]